MLLRRVADDARGVSAIEFAVVAPVLIVGIMGMFDLGYNIYTDALLQGAVQKAARDSTIEGAPAKANVLDAKVARIVHQIAPRAALTYERKAYASFGDVNQPEDFTDLDDDGICNNGEPFEDANGSGVWDSDRSVAGFGGARDAVLYTVTVDYPRPFPVAKLIGQSGEFKMVATTVLRNQPFNLQTIRAKTGNCP